MFSVRSLTDLALNGTLEDRVELLEIQVVAIEDEVTELESDVEFLFDQQLIQDQKLLDLEQETDAKDAHVEGK